MSTFIAMHTITPHMPVEDAARLVYSVLTSMRPGMTWKRYWICDERGKMFCLWDAHDAEELWEVLNRAAMPTDSVCEVDEGDPELFRQGLDTETNNANAAP
jgi:hypothetical protein